MTVAEQYVPIPLHTSISSRETRDEYSQQRANVAPYLPTKHIFIAKPPLRFSGLRCANACVDVRVSTLIHIVAQYLLLH